MRESSNVSMKQTTEQVQKRLKIANYILVFAFLVIFVPPVMKAWEGDNSIPPQYGKMEYVAKETDEFLPMIFILVILINSSFLLCKEVKEIQMKIDALTSQTGTD